MKTVLTIVSAAILMYGATKAPGFVLKEMKKIALTKVDKGLPSMEAFTYKLTDHKE